MAAQWLGEGQWQLGGRINRYPGWAYLSWKKLPEEEEMTEGCGPTGLGPASIDSAQGQDHGTIKSPGGSCPGDGEGGSQSESCTGRWGRATRSLDPNPSPGGRGHQHLVRR